MELAMAPSSPSFTSHLLASHRRFCCTFLPPSRPRLIGVLRYILALCSSRLRTHERSDLYLRQSGAAAEQECILPSRSSPLFASCISRVSFLRSLHRVLCFYLLGPRKLSYKLVPLTVEVSTRRLTPSSRQAAPHPPPRARARARIKIHSYRLLCGESTKSQKDSGSSQMASELPGGFITAGPRVSVAVLATTVTS